MLGIMHARILARGYVARYARATVYALHSCTTRVRRDPNTRLLPAPRARARAHTSLRWPGDFHRRGDFTIVRLER